MFSRHSPCYLPTLDSVRTFHKVPGVRFSRCTISSCIRFIQVTCGNLYPRCRMNKWAKCDGCEILKVLTWLYEKGCFKITTWAFLSYTTVAPFSMARHRFFANAQCSILYIEKQT